MATVTEKRPVIPIPFRSGMYSAGDASQVPDGFCRKARNVVIRPLRASVRPPLVFDNVVVVHSLMNFEDGANKVTRLVSLDNGGAVYVKATTGEYNAFTFSEPGFADDRVLSFCNYHGLLYYASDTAGFDNNTVVTTDTASQTSGSVTFGPANSGIRPTSIESHGDRIYAFGCTLAISNSLGLTYAYDPASWTRTTTNTDTITASGATTYRILPTNATGAQLVSSGLALNVTGPIELTYLAQLGGDHQTYRVPMTQEIYINYIWTTLTAYLLNAIRTPTTLNGFRYRVTTAGTSAAGEPAWGTTLGGTTADGSVVWTCEGSDTLASQSITVPSISDTPDFVSYYVGGKLDTPCSTRVAARLKFGNASSATLSTLAAVRFAYKDGAADGAANKQNFGQQVTASSYKHPFMNQESSANATKNISDDVLWCETGESGNVTAANFYRCTNIAGGGRAIKSVGGRLLAAKRNTIWVFADTSDAANPILPETVLKGIGCIGPRAHDEFEGYWYFIGENEIYRYRPGGDPEPLCGDAMREEIMARGSGWVESQATYNLPMLRIDAKNREVWVYTQKGKIYVYHLNYQAWTVFDIGGGSSLSPVGYEVRDMLYNPNTQTMYVAFGTAAAGTAGLARASINFPAWAVARAYTTNYTVVPTVSNGLRYRATTGGTSHATTEPTWPTTPGATVTDNTVTWTCEDTNLGAYDTISNSGTLPVYRELWLKPLELTAPRYDAICEEIGLHHTCTVNQATLPQTTKVYVSFDEGVSFPVSNQVTLNTSTGGKIRDPIPLWHMGASMMPRIESVGYGGEANFSISVIDATLQVKRGEYPAANPTPGVVTT